MPRPGRPVHVRAAVKRRATIHVTARGLRRRAAMQRGRLAMLRGGKCLPSPQCPARLHELRQRRCAPVQLSLYGPVRGYFPVGPRPHLLRGQSASNRLRLRGEWAPLGGSTIRGATAYGSGESIRVIQRIPAEMPTRSFTPVARVSPICRIDPGKSGAGPGSPSPIPR